MNINLNEKIGEHLARLESLAQEADSDHEESYSSRAAAMRALSQMLAELSKTQAEVINMERLMRLEQILKDTIRKYLPEEHYESFLKDLETSLPRV